MANTKECTFGCGTTLIWDKPKGFYKAVGTEVKHDCSANLDPSQPRPKFCKYGCKQMVVWDDDLGYMKDFPVVSNDRHDCPAFKNGGGPNNQQGGNRFVKNSSGGGNYPYNNKQNNLGGPNPNQNQQETLIGVQAKKTWENYFKHLEAINPNLVAIHSEVQNTNSLLSELVRAIKALDDTLTVLKIKSTSTTTETGENKENDGA